MQATLPSLPTTLTSASSDGSDVDVYELLGEFWVSALTNARETLDQYIQGLEGAEKAKFEKIRKQIDEYLEQLAKSKKASGLQKFFKALGAIGMVLAVITAVLIPSPMTIAILIVTVAMFLEPLISKAAGGESMLEKGMAEMFKGLSDALGPIGAAVVASLIMITLAVAATAAVGGAISMLSASANATAQSLRTLVQELPKMIMRFFRSELTEAQSQALRRFLEVAQSSILLAQSGLQIDISRLQFEAAELMKAYGIDQALIDGWISTIDLLTQDTKGQQEFLGHLEQLLPYLFDKPE